MDAKITIDMDFLMSDPEASEEDEEEKVLKEFYRFNGPKKAYINDSQPIVENIAKFYGMFRSMDNNIPEGLQKAEYISFISGAVVKIFGLIALRADQSAVVTTFATLFLSWPLSAADPVSLDAEALLTLERIVLIMDDSGSHRLR